jgi:hypothetical protein
MNFVGGDAEGARSLRRALEALRDSAEVAPGLQARVAAVLSGDLGMRELAADRGLQEIAGQGIDQLREELDDMSPEDRSDLVRRSTALAAEFDRDQRWPSAREPADP